MPKPRFITIGIVSLLLFSSALCPILAQVQPNSAGATLLVDNRGGLGFGGSLPLLLAPLTAFVIELQGPPFAPFVAAIDAAPLVPPLSTAAGFLHLNLATLTQVANGITTDATGRFLAPITTGLPAGISVSLQAAVLNPSGLILTAPAQILGVPGAQIPSGLSFASVPNPNGNARTLRHAVAADVNMDGIPDYINDAGVWLGQPVTSLTTLPLVLAGPDPAGIEIACANFLGSPAPDLLIMQNNGSVLNCAQNSLCLRIFAGNGTGLFPATPAWQTGFFGADGSDFDVADYDNDGDLDIAAVVGTFATALGPTTATIFENNGNSTFTPRLITGATVCQTVTSADFNLDGFRDLAIDANGVAQVLFGTGVISNFSLSLSLTVQGLPPGDQGARWLRAKDLDGDNDSDLLWAGNSSMGVLLNVNRQALTFSYRPIPFTPASGAPLPQMEAWDCDSDGLMDVVFPDRIANPVHWAVVAHQSVSATFTELWHLPLADLPGGVEPGHILAADLPGTPGVDLFCDGEIVTVILNQN